MVLTVFLYSKRDLGEAAGHEIGVEHGYYCDERVGALGERVWDCVHY